MSALVPWFLLLVAAAPMPPPLSLTAEEEEALDRREIVVRSDLADPTGGSATGVIEVAAPVERTLAAVMDLRARVGEISGLKGLEEYGRGPDWVGARWTVRVLTTTVVFHVRYAIDADRGLVSYTLDPSQSPNDIVRTEGSYQLLPIDGGTRLIYRSSSDSGRSVPTWLKRWLANEALTQQLTGIRKRAEAGR